MNRQYIGARYVPKFSDINGGVWNNTYSYEPLEIVKHGNDFYTSKKPVPVGIPITDNEYWVLTGNYSGAISQLHEELDELTEIVDNKTAHIYTLEDFGAVGDGIHDDSDAFELAFNTVVENKVGTIIGCGKYKISKTLVLNGEDDGYNSVNILIGGHLIVDNTITIKNITRSTINIKLVGGGNGSVNTSCIILDDMQSCTCNLFASGVQATAFQILRGQWNTVRVDGRYNIRTLYHGSPDVTNAHAFGTYLSIHDYCENYPIRFEKSNDVTILHFEGFFSNSERNMFEIVNCSMINFESFAQGGIGLSVLYVNNSKIHINYCFMVNEEDQSGTPTTIGIHAINSSRVFVDYLNGYFMAKLIKSENLSTNNGCINVTNFVIRPEDENRTTIVDNDGVADNIYINGYMIERQLTAPATEGVDISLLKAYIIGDTMKIQGSLRATSNITAYSPVLNLPAFPLGDLAYVASTSAGAIYPFYAQSNQLWTRLQIPANTGIPFCLEYKIRDYSH